MFQHRYQNTACDRQYTVPAQKANISTTLWDCCCNLSLHRKAILRMFYKAKILSWFRHCNKFLCHDDKASLPKLCKEYQGRLWGRWEDGQRYHDNASLWNLGVPSHRASKRNHNYRLWADQNYTTLSYLLVSCPQTWSVYWQEMQVLHLKNVPSPKPNNLGFF